MPEERTSQTIRLRLLKERYRICLLVAVSSFCFVLKTEGMLPRILLYKWKAGEFGSNEILSFRFKPIEAVLKRKAILITEI